MMNRRTRLSRAQCALLGATVALAVLGAACRSDEPDATPTPEPTPTAEATPDMLVASPHSLQSYRYAVTVTALLGALGGSDAPAGLPLDQPAVITVEGERINPDRERSTASIDLGFLSVSIETVEIGSQRWVREGSRPWTETAGGGVDILGGFDFRPAAIFADEPAEYEALAERLAAYPSSEASVDGVPARHYVFTEDEFFEVFQGQGEIVPADVEAALAAEVWLSERYGVPIRLIVTGTDEAGAEVIRLEMHLSDLDDASISIEAPE
jgi:hypothetical protein